MVTVVDMIPELFPQLFSTVWDEHLRERKRRCILAANAVICISEATAWDVQSFYGVGADLIHVVPLSHSQAFANRDKCSQRSLLRSDRPFLLYVGTRTHYKNFDLLIQAYSMWSLRDEVNLLVVGGPWLSHESECLDRLEISNSVSLLSGVEDIELCQLYNQAVAFVYPSLYEGFGIPLLEAMACGCPVVASRIPSTVEVAGECPFYFEPTDANSLLAALGAALSEGRDSTHAQSGIERAAMYSWEETARKTLGVYRKMANDMQNMHQMQGPNYGDLVQ